MKSHIKFKGFTLEVNGHEFPQTSSQESIYDANWLVVSASLKTDAGSLEFRDEACLLTWEIESFSSNLGWFTTPTQHKNWFVELRPLEPFVKIEIEHRERLSIFIQIMAVSDESVQHFSVRWDITQIELENLYKQFLELSQTFPVKKEQS